ncbi:MAG TPA: sigma factor [Mycobacteriales bacterium]|nr:sigma factor [Mycobacteriales bacterium]
MARTAVEDAVQETDLLRLREPVRRYLSRTVSDEQELDDLVQETLLRVWEVRGRVGRAAAAAYAVATARNLVQNRERARQLHARHAHRLHEPDFVDGPEVDALRREERMAAAQVARTLDDDDLALLSPAAAGAASPQERTARRRSRLARARAKARVDYLLHLRRLVLPTSRCRPVLEALSAGDRRQQERTGVARHLLGCPVCAGCAPALLARERRMFGFVALPLLILLEPLRRTFARAPRTVSAATAAAVAVVVAGLVVALWPAGTTSPSALPAAAPAAPAPAAPAPPPGLTLDAGQGFDIALPDLLGRPVAARGVLVRSVPADEGFWVGPDDATQLFVHLPEGVESPQAVRPGDRVSFTGTVRALEPAVVGGVDPAEGLTQLTREGGYLSVPGGQLIVDPAG